MCKNVGFLGPLEKKVEKTELNKRAIFTLKMKNDRIFFENWYVCSPGDGDYKYIIFRALRPLFQKLQGLKVFRDIAATCFSRRRN